MNNSVWKTENKNQNGKLVLAGIAVHAGYITRVALNVTAISLRIGLKTSILKCHAL